MPRAQSVDIALQDALELSRRLEERRGSIQPFEIRRLAQQATLGGDNQIALLVRDALVAEIERDYALFDSTLEQLLQCRLPSELLLNLSTIALFAFNPRITVTMLRSGIEYAKGNPDFLNILGRSAWFCGDLELWQEIRERIHGLGAEMQLDGHDNQDIIRVLASSGVNLETYREYVFGLHDHVRRYADGQVNTSILLSFEPVAHEDGAESVVLEIFSDMDSDALDRLDDELLDYASDIDRWGIELSATVTTLVRDIPDQNLAEAV